MLRHKPAFEWSRMNSEHGKGLVSCVHMSLSDPGPPQGEAAVFSCPILDSNSADATDDITFFPIRSTLLIYITISQFGLMHGPQVHLFLPPLTLRLFILAPSINFTGLKLLRLQFVVSLIFGVVLCPVRGKVSVLKLICL